MSGKWLPGRAGKDAAGPAAGGEAQQPRGRFSLPGTGTHLPSSVVPGARARSLGVFHLRVSQHSANSQQDVSFKWRIPHVSSSGYAEN